MTTATHETETEILNRLLIETDNQEAAGNSNNSINNMSIAEYQIFAKGYRVVKEFKQISMMGHYVTVEALGLVNEQSGDKIVFLLNKQCFAEHLSDLVGIPSCAGAQVVRWLATSYEQDKEQEVELAAEKKRAEETPVANPRRLSYFSRNGK